MGGNKGLPVIREEADVTYRQKAVYKGKRGNPVFTMKCLILIRLIRSAKKGFLIAEL